MTTPQQKTAIRKIAQSIGVKSLSDSEIDAVQERAAALFKKHPELAASEIYKRSIGDGKANKRLDDSARKALSQTPARATRGIEDFAQRVEHAAKTSKSGWFGDNKVFVNHVWRNGFRDMSLDAFKRRLVEAHRAGLISLARADLVEAMNPRDVEESGIEYLGRASWNFVRTDR